MAEQRTRNDNVHAILAANVKKFRKQAKLSQERLSELCGLNRSYVGRLERDHSNLELSTMQSLADQLNVTVADLVSPPNRRNR